jgi:glycosyltransferase involved in cell wall biosynthesis
MILHAVGYQKDAGAATCRATIALVVAPGSVSKALRPLAEPSPGVVRSVLDGGSGEPRIVVDVTSSVLWSGAPVGIVRTVRQFATFLLDRDDVRATFCRYDAGRRRYVGIERARVLSGACDPRPGRIAAAVVSAGRRIVDGLPRGMQADAVLLARSTGLALKSSYWLARGAWNAIRPRPRPRADEPGDVELGPSDVYVSMGVDWQHNDLRVLLELKRTCGFRAVLYCHDLIPVTLPHLTSAEARPPSRAHFLDLARAADHVVAVSRTTAEELRRFLGESGVPVPPISVAHPGADFDARVRAAARAPRDDLARTPFVLCVATIEMRKNHELLYNVWDRLVARHGDRVPLLVLVGMVGWGVHDLLVRMRANRRVAQCIVLLGAVADEELVWLYEHCLFSVYPSFFEGWGLPVAESLGLGTPCVTSSAPAVVEAGGGLAAALDPLDFPAWLAEVERLAFEPAAREAAARRAREYRATSWREHGEAILHVIRDVRLALRREF